MMQTAVDHLSAVTKDEQQTASKVVPEQLLEGENDSEEIQMKDSINNSTKNATLVKNVQL